MASASSWLCRSDTDRERMLDMERRIGPLRAAAMGVLAVALAICGPWLGFWTLGPLAAAGVVFAIADRRMSHATRPEYAIFAAWAGSEIIIAVAVAMTGGPNVPTIAWFAIPVVTLSARFSMRGVLLGVAFTLCLLVAVAFGVDGEAVLDNPPLLIAPAALIVSLSILSMALMQSDVQHRSEAVIDPLTGMLNRNALSHRVRELAHQSEVTGESVGLVIGDIDHFKRVNDRHGHAAGDAVLTDVGYVLRKRLRAFDLAYRLGGEEFLVLLPGADLNDARAMAEHLREAVAESFVGDGNRVTMSFGVSASERGNRFDYDVAFARADAALYEAKRTGRNRVCVSGTVDQQAA